MTDIAVTSGGGSQPTQATAAGLPKPRYNDTLIKYFTIATLFWGIAGFLVGILIAAQMAFPQLNLEPYLTFGRLRPLHTSAVIFAFGGNALLGTSYHVVQRTCRTRLFSDKLGWFTFWGYQVFILIAGLGYVFGVTQGLEYAEPEWYADLWLTIVWVAYLINYLGTLWNRQEKHIYVANWFYLAFIVTIAILHIVNNMALPVSLTSVHSYSTWAGVQSAMIQWWYGHNAVAFFLTAGFLGMMYYFVPKQANRPIYSYRLSIIHFWSLIFIYMWAGPHHLIYTSLPDWAQTLGMTFSIMLWMPSWGGMINGMMSLSGAWHKLRDDPVLQFMIIALAFYGIATFEGPLLSIKAVNSLSHYTEWTVGHVHAGVLGWNGFITFGALYYLVPNLWKKKGMYSTKLISVHLWVATLGIVLYITSMWVAGIMQGLMWRAYNEMGFLTYSFVETVEAMKPYYIIRILGGVLYLTGALVMVYNVWKTIKSPQSESVDANAAKSEVA
ncbi:cytochrome-c oxidase, cbb3-type subunit I [Asticcacaulis tiandongensis]|uniref:cytochrome-c oxidase, cbb3-type subunit I n=1 Tax=Asticcacaulis tiandongensis TaxID=2565365 RepID=UPI00112EE44B|nr:cytochrome-c oxidase, cbb3-type subunit I [Asticcacaulis tiandongensis]